MATKTVVCPECDSPLSPGRFACPSCGALVASVASVSRSFTPPEVTVPAILAAMDEDEPVQSRRAKLVTSPRRVKLPSRPGKQESVVAAGIAEPVPQPPVDVRQAPLTWVLDDSVRGAAPNPTATPPSPPAASAAPPVAPPAPAAAPSWPDRPSWPPQRSVDAVAPPVESAAARVPAGAYLPPSAVLPPGEALPVARTNGHAENGARPGQAGSTSRSLHLRLGEGEGPWGMPTDAPTRIVILGAGLAGLGFLLPWAEIVIGSGSIGGYLEQWGLAGPGHILILALIVGLAALAFVAERLPRWVRLGLPSIGLACLLTGLVWPYLVGPFDALIGVYVVAVGALVMIAGGLLDRVATRHAESSASV